MVTLTIITFGFLFKISCKMNRETNMHGNSSRHYECGKFRFQRSSVR